MVYDLGILQSHVSIFLKRIKKFIYWKNERLVYKLICQILNTKQNVF